MIQCRIILVVRECAICRGYASHTTLRDSGFSTDSIQFSELGVNPNILYFFKVADELHDFVTIPRNISKFYFMTILFYLSGCRLLGIRDLSAQQFGKVTQKSRFRKILTPLRLSLFDQAREIQWNEISPMAHF